jgi:hypothetical protein
MPLSASTLLGLALDFYTISVALASGAYIRTENPKFNGLRDEGGEYRGLTAPSYQKGSKFPNLSDDHPFSFPSTQGIPNPEDAEAGHLEPPRGLDMGANEAELSFLTPSSAHSRVHERGYNPPEGPMERY